MEFTHIFTKHDFSMTVRNGRTQAYSDDWDSRRTVEFARAILHRRAEWRFDYR